MAVDVVMQTFAAVLLQLDLFDADRPPHHLVPLLSSEEAVSQRAIDCDGPPLLGDLVAGLRFGHKPSGIRRKPTDSFLVLRAAIVMEMRGKTLVP